MKVKIKKSVKVNKVNTTTTTPEKNKTPQKVAKTTEKEKSVKEKSVNTPVKKEKVKKDQKDSPKSLKYKYPEGYSQLEMKKFRMKVRKGLDDLNKKLSQVPKDSEDYKKLLQELEDFKLKYYNYN